MKRHKNPHTIQSMDGSRGFTLLETCFAIVIFTFGTLALMTLSINSMNWFSQSRISATEVNRTALNLEAIKKADYNDAGVFTGAVQSTPAGTDGITVGYTDANNAVVMETKLITFQNNSIPGAGAGGNWEIYYIKPIIR